MVIEISDLNINEFEQIYENMRLQFPKFELKSFDDFLELFKNEKYNCVICHYNKQKAGYLIYHKNDYLWADYLAIDVKMHATGIGTKFLKKWLTDNKNYKGCFFEIEEINESDIQTTRRQNFYKQLGCKKLDFEYYFPSYPKLLPMDLFYLPLNAPEVPTKHEIMAQIEEIFATLHFKSKSKDKCLKRMKKINGC